MTIGGSSRQKKRNYLLKNNKSWEWTKRCQNAFEELKAAVTQEPVLVLPDFEKVLEVHTDASDLSIGGVLMQEGPSPSKAANSMIQSEDTECKRRR